jgi:methylated-DNA-[protein]-cysteine S-methyltransferase
MSHVTIAHSPLGPLTLVADGDGTLTGLYTPDDPRAAALRPSVEPPGRRFAPVLAQLDAFFARERTTFDLPLRLEGTTFQVKVWQALLEIPYGTTTTYGELARQFGGARAARAVGAANGRNPIAIVVPCHRVIGARGALTGYAGGLACKERLLALEGALLAA